MFLGIGLGVGIGGRIGSPYGPDSTVTLNPSDKGANIVLSNGDLTATNSVNSTFHSARTTAAPISSGVRYWEIVLGSTAAADNIYYLGVCDATFVLTSVPGQDTTCFGWRLGTNPPIGRYNAANATGSFGVQGTAGDVIGLLFDRTNKTLTAWQNATSLGSIFSGAGEMPTIAGSWEPYVCVNGAGGVAKSVTARFAASSWSYPLRGVAAGASQW